MTKISLPAILVTAGILVSVGIATGIFLLHRSDPPSATSNESSGQHVLKEKELTFEDVENAALEKWKLQGFRLNLRLDPKGEVVSGEPQCRKYGYYLQYDGGGPATANIIICGKQFTIEDAITADQAMRMATGHGLK